MNAPRAEVALGPELEACMRDALAGRSFELVGRERLKEDVHRLLVLAGGTERSLVVKRSDPLVARRNWLVTRRWLPAVGLQDLGPPLLALGAESGEGTWQAYEDLRGRPLVADPPVAPDVEAAIDAIARVHTAFAEHRLLRECRLWGGDRGIHHYSANLRDAVTALRSLDPGEHGPAAVAARDELLDRIERLRADEPERARVMAAAGGPETLLHGDLWPTNVIVVSNGGAAAVRLIDWDEAAAGPVWFDLSTFLLRFDPARRDWILNTYERAVERLAGWRAPPRGELNVMMATAAYGRLASLLVWSVAAAEEGDSGWLSERLVALSGWLDEVEPVLPAR